MAGENKVLAHPARLPLLRITGCQPEPETLRTERTHETSTQGKNRRELCQEHLLSPNRPLPRTRTLGKIKNQSDRNGRGHHKTIEATNAGKKEKNRT